MGGHAIDKVDKRVGRDEKDDAAQKSERKQEVRPDETRRAARGAVQRRGVFVQICIAFVAFAQRCHLNNTV